MYQKQLTKEYIQKLLLQVRLDIDLNQNIMTLSLGEKQRLSLVCSLIKEPTFLILDEPTASLDQENEKIILDILDELSKKGITILIASHSEIVEHYAQCIYVIEDTHLIKVKDDFQEELVNVNHHNKIQRNFLKNYVFNYIKHYRFLYSFLVMILTLSLLSMNVFNIFLEYSKENSIKILEGQFNNKLVITQDEENMFLNQDYTTYICLHVLFKTLIHYTKCQYHIMNKISLLFPILKMITLIDNLLVVLTMIKMAYIWIVQHIISIKNLKHMIWK